MRLLHDDNETVQETGCGTWRVSGFHRRAGLTEAA